MTEELILETWSNIKSLREQKGVSLDSLSEKMRLPVERIEYLEAGDFSEADPIITKLQLKNYARILDIDYETISELAGFNIPKVETIAEPLGENVKIKKTRTYRGRKKEPKKGLIYVAIIVACIVTIIILNRLAIAFNINSDVFEMTEEQVNALDTPIESEKDTGSFKPFLPQVKKEAVDVDIISTMTIKKTKSISFPVKIKVFPKQDISYRQELKGLKNIENYILKDTPTLLELNKPGRTIFYHANDTRFVIDGDILKDENLSLLLVEINEDRELSIYTK